MRFSPDYVASVLQRTEMVRRIADEIGHHIIELGAEARLVRLQLDELLGDIDDDRWLVLQDYCHDQSADEVDDAVEVLAGLSTDDLLDLRVVAEVLSLPEGIGDLDRPMQPRGHRLLAKVPRLPEPVVDNVVDRFGNLQKIMRATTDDLANVDGIGRERARAIKEGLARLTESSILDRYN